MEQNQEILEQLLRLLSENGRAGQSEDLSRLMFYMDGMSRQLEAVQRELQTVKAQLAQTRDAPQKTAVQEMVNRLQSKVRQAQEKLDGLREKIIQGAARAVEGFQRTGVRALDKAAAAMGLHRALDAIQKNLSRALDDTRTGIEKLETLGRELRSVGGHLKNAGRAVTGKETQAVDGGREGRFQSAVLTPMRTVQKLLSNMNNTTLAAIGNVERLETAAETIREERQAARKPSISEMPDRQPEQTELSPDTELPGSPDCAGPFDGAPAADTRPEKPSIRQTLQEKKVEAAALPAPDQGRKAPEAAR